MLYEVLKHPMQLALRIFFKQINIVGLEHIPKSGPVVLAATHPNSFTDDVVLGAVLHRNLRFLARGDVFKKRWATVLLHSMHVYPIYRGGANGGDVEKNLDNFSFYRDYLKKGKTILIHPEGICVNEKNVRPLKKGIGRIAIQAEAECDWELGLKIIPIALNYSNAPYHNERLMIQIAPAIDSTNFKDSYLENPNKAYAELSNILFQSLAENSIIQQKGTEKICETALEICRNNQKFKWNLDNINQYDLPFAIEKKPADQLNDWQENNPEKFKTIYNQLTEYQSTLNQYGIGDENISTNNKKLKLPLLLKAIYGIAHFLGDILFILPISLAYKLTNKMIKSIEFHASVLLGLSFVLTIVNQLIILGVLFYIFGAWALFYFPFAYYVAKFLMQRNARNQKIRNAINFNKLKQTNKAKVEELNRLRNQICTTLEI